MKINPKQIYRRCGHCNIVSEYEENYDDLDYCEQCMSTCCIYDHDYPGNFAQSVFLTGDQLTAEDIRHLAWLAGEDDES